MKNRSNQLTRENLKVVKEQWPSEAGTHHFRVLRSLTKRYGFAVVLGDLLLLDGKRFVTHSGLLRLAERRSCAGINVQQVRDFCDPIAARWVFKATVYKNRCLRGFVGHGDADPSNVSTLVRGTEVRIAETRAVSRALRKAYGIGLCCVEELGELSSSSTPANNYPEPTKSQPQKASNNGQPRLRDRLRLDRMGIRIELPLASPKAVSGHPVCRARTKSSRIQNIFRAPVLHTESTLEIKLVSAGFWLRPRFASSRSDRRKSPCEPPRHRAHLLS